jgi:ubiquinone/menaquinone biosynthesis C-methylase UbiE
VTSHRDSTQRFGERAGAYAAHRPTYPAPAVEAVFAGLGDPSALQIADVGAGTGISSRLFAQRGALVVAIEPNAAMRSAAEAHPRVVWREGTAEATGLNDGAVDIVTACQAYHWFATARATEELVRIARRRVVILQYERDEEDAFTKAYGDVVRAYATDDTEAMRATAPAAFQRHAGVPIATQRFASRQRFDVTSLLGRASSASYLPSEGEAARALQRELRANFDLHQRDGFVELAMQTLILVADMPPRGG